MSGDQAHTDVAPGDTGHGGASPAQGIRNYVFGLALAVLLTAASFGLVGTGFIYGPGLPVALVVLGVAQVGVHIVFFLHLTSGPDNTNNALALAFGVLIALLVMCGTLWIMADLHAQMPHVHGGAGHPMPPRR